MLLPDAPPPVDLPPGGYTFEARLVGFNPWRTSAMLEAGQREAIDVARDSADPASAGYLRSSRFGQAATTAGGVFGSGGPRAMQLAVRVTF